MDIELEEEEMNLELPIQVQLEYNVGPDNFTLRIKTLARDFVDPETKKRTKEYNTVEKTMTWRDMEMPKWRDMSLKGIGLVTDTLEYYPAEMGEPRS